MFRRSIIFAGLVGVNCGPRFHSSCDGHDQSLVAFSPKKFNKFPITKINVLSHNTKVCNNSSTEFSCGLTLHGPRLDQEYVVALPSPEHEMGLETAGLVMIKGPPGEKVIARPYTPTSLNGTDHFIRVAIGWFYLIVCTLIKTKRDHLSWS